MKTFPYCAISNQGKVRANNEDNFYMFGFTPSSTDIDKPEVSLCGLYKFGKAKSALICVADGMGGMNAGEEASAFVVRSIEPNENFMASLTAEDRANYLEEQLADLNEQLYAFSKTETKLDGLGTTFVGLAIDKKNAYILNAGDSRCYLFRKSKAYQLSNDHSEAARLIRMGLMSPEDAFGSKEKSMIYRYIGMPPEAGKLECSRSMSIKLKRSDLFLLCSDGLTDMLKDEEIEKIMKDSKNIANIARRLIDAALNNGGADNITVIVCRV